MYEFWHAGETASQIECSDLLWKVQQIQMIVIRWELWTPFGEELEVLLLTDSSCKTTLAPQAQCQQFALYTMDTKVR